MIIRRLYIYAVAAAGLAFLVLGLCGAGSTLIELFLRGGALGSDERLTIAWYCACIVVALPIWVLHWHLAQRLAGRDAAERAATLRRLYLYGALGALLLTLGQLASHVLGAAFGMVLGVEDFAQDGAAIELVRTLWELAVVAAFWAYTLRVAEADRIAVGEDGNSATLRRWYAYGAQFVALLAGLFGAEALLHAIFTDFIARPIVTNPGGIVAHGVAQTLVGFGVWVWQRHWVIRVAPGEDEQRSTLRAVYGFGIVGIAVVATLGGAGRVAYWVLARVLGVPHPSGVPSEVVPALSGAVATGVVFGAAWALIHRELARDSAGAPAERQVGIRRLYEHLVAFAALGTFASGAGLLLWTLFDQVLAPGVAISNIDFLDRTSLSITLILVGLPVWLMYWRPEASPDDRLSLSRRLYVFAALLGGVLAGLGSGIWFASQLLRLLLGVGSSQPAVDVSHALGLLLVAAVTGVYHARVLRADTLFRNARNRAVTGPVLPSANERAAAGRAPIVVEISGATEEDIRSALGALPAQATYQLRAK